MKTKDELIKWFWNIFNSCYLVKHEDYPKSIFMYYDQQYIRKQKLSKISGEQTYNKTDITDITGICLFEQDWENMIFRCKYDEIWNYLYINYSTYYIDVQEFIKERLEEHSKMSTLTLHSVAPIRVVLLEEHQKMSTLTLNRILIDDEMLLAEHTKMNILTPQFGQLKYHP